MAIINGVGAGQRLGDFEILRELGRGGMGIVFEARQVSLNRKVALKVMAQPLGVTQRALQRFQREAEAAAKLHHTNIVPIYATGEENGVCYYAMELIDGPSLDQVLRDLAAARRGARDRKPAADGDAGAPGHPAALPAPSGSTVDFDGGAAQAGASPAPQGSTAGSSALGSGREYFDTVARLFGEVADALDHAHQQGVIHRDIKPSNLLLSRSGRLHVNDFGLARLVEQPGMTVTGEFVGTPAYMSPEQITAGRTPLDHRTDIYSLGATLYEVLTLERPFRGERRDQVLAQIIHKEPRRPRRVHPDVPLDLETICLKALDKDPDRRYQSAAALADDLRRYLNRFAITARRAGLATRLRKWTRRHPGLAAALAALMVAVAAAGFFAWRSDRESRERQADREVHDNTVRAEKRRAVLDKAILSAMGGDFAMAEQCVGEAEALAAAPGEVQMLRGQISLLRGLVPEAVEQLEKAVALMPDSVSARARLSMAYFSAGMWDRCEKMLREARNLTPQTPEDYLFVGASEANVDAEAGLKSMDKAIQQRPSVVAHLLRADARFYHVMDTADPRHAEIMLQDAEAARQLLPDNPAALATSLQSYTLAAGLYEETGQQERRQAAMERARRDADALKRFPNHTATYAARWSFLDYIGEAQTALEELQEARQQLKDPLVTFTYGYVLYKHGRNEEAVKALEETRGIPMGDLARAFVLAELPDGPERAWKVYQELSSKEIGGWIRFNSQLLLLYLGRKSEAREVARALADQPDQHPLLWRRNFERAVQFCAGRLSADDWLRAAANSRGELCNAHLCIGLTALADGKRDDAKRHFRASVATRAFVLYPYGLSSIFITKMNDPEWPRWIGPQR